MNTVDNLRTLKGCVGFLLSRRLYCRRLVRVIDTHRDANAAIRRHINKLRSTEEPLLTRRADVLQAELDAPNEAYRQCREMLRVAGKQLMAAVPQINAMVPQALLLDLINTNRADRNQVEPGWGFAEIVFAYNLEDSATKRTCEDSKQGPLFEAYYSHFAHELTTNRELGERLNEMTFGKGGMFEFVPTYQKDAQGQMVRVPPKLRLADACDAPPSRGGKA